MLISNLPAKTTILSTDSVVCSAVVDSVVTTILIPWADVITALNLSTSGSAIVAIKSVTLTTPLTTTSANGTWADATGLSITYSPTSSSNLIFVMANISIGNQAGSNSVAVRMMRGSTPIGISTSSAGGSSFAASGHATSSNNDSMESIGVSVMDSPATTSSTVWKIQFCSTTGGGGQASINASYNDGTAAYSCRTASTLTIMEITA